MMTAPPSTSSPSCCRRPSRFIPPFRPQENKRTENVMRNWIARRMLRATRKRYGYDTSYLEMMLEQSPNAFFKFAPLMKAAGHREVVAVEVCFAAKLVGSLAEDCGPCTQLCVDMAL